MDIIKNYIDEFNRNDVETIKNDIDNAHVYEWMKAEVPVFECPDKEIERAYYFRFRTYRKYIKTTKDDIVITEWSCCDRNEKRAVGVTALFLTNQNLSSSLNKPIVGAAIGSPHGITCCNGRPMGAPTGSISQLYNPTPQGVPKLRIEHCELRIYKSSTNYCLFST